MTFLQTLFREVAAQIGKPYNELLPFMKKLEENWFDSEEAVQAISDQQFDSMKFPKRLVVKIRQQFKHKVQPMEEAHQIQSQSKQMTEVKPQKVQKTDLAYEDTFLNFIEALKKQTMMNKSKIIEIVDLLIKIVQNILKSPEDQKFRKIKIGNKKFNDCINPYHCCNYIIQYLGFFKGKQQINMVEADTGHLSMCLAHLENCRSIAQAIFDPYQASYNSSNQMPNTIQIAQQNGSQITQYNKMLDDLIQYRKKIMSNPPKDRLARIYHKKYEAKSVNFKQVIFEQELQKSHDPMMQQYWKKIVAMNTSNSNFQSKRRIQFEALLKQPIYDKTLVKIKLPNDYIIQGIFGPLEKIEKVVNFAKSFIIGQVYIFTTPPVVQMSKHLQKSLNDLECVPMGIFYLSATTTWAIKNEFVPFVMH